MTKEEFMQTIISTAIGVIFGGIITWIVAWYYYMKAGKELLEESKILKQTSDLILYKLQYPDAPTELKRNEKGEVVGLIVNMSAKM
jgi:peptidoglycan biosynthesis protein MviN/MurJ (putative lipid II flippase)